MKKFLVFITIIGLCCCAIFSAVACGKKECSHEFGEWQVITEPTCTENGLREHSCTKEDCTHSVSETIGKLEHDFENGITLFDETHHYKICSRCPVSNLENKEAHIGGTATCTEKAKCSVCNAEYGDLLSHDLVNSTAYGYNKEGHWKICANCTEKGEIENHIPNIPNATETTSKVCTVCDYVLEPQIGHQHQFTIQKAEQQYQVSPSTCQNKAIYYYSCECGAIGEETFNCGEYSDHIYGDLVVAKQANCQTVGHGAYYQCSVCDKYFTENKIQTTLEALTIEKDSSVHTDSALKYLSNDNGTHDVVHNCCGKAVQSSVICADTDKDSDCTTAEVCDDCGYIIKVANQAHLWDKDYLQANADENKHYHVCLDCGIRDSGEEHNPDYPSATEEHGQICTDCGYVIAGQLGHTHNFNQENTNVGYLLSEATCVKKAVYYFSCSCGKIGSETFEGDSFAEHSLNTMIAEIPATCKDEGREGYYQCSVCYKYFNGQKQETEFSALTIPIDENAHITPLDYTYTSNGDGTHIKKYKCCNAKVSEDCSGGIANCLERKICQHCGITYGEIDFTNHVSQDFKYLSNLDGTHMKTYACCDTIVDSEENCSGGTQTCALAPICSACNVAYGSGSGAHDYTFGTWIENGTAYIKQCKNCSRTSYSVNVFGAYEIADFEGRNTIALKNNTSAVEIKFSGNQIVIVLGYEYLLQDSGSQSVKVYIDGVEKQTITLTGTGYNAYTVNLDTTGNHVAKIYKVTDESAGLVYLSHFKGTGISFLPYDYHVLHDFDGSTEYKNDGTYHWKVCSGCLLEDTENKVACSGGTATCGGKPLCEVCNLHYGSALGNHDFTFGTWIKEGDKYTKQCKGCDRLSYSLSPYGAIQISNYSGRNALALKDKTSAVEFKFTGNQVVIVVAQQYLLNDGGSHTLKVYIDDIAQTPIVLSGTDYTAYTYNLSTSTTHICKVFKELDSSAGYVYFSHLRGTGTTFLKPNHIHTYATSNKYATDGTQHWKICDVYGCNARDLVNKEDHYGGTQTCGSGPICSACKVEYGSGSGAHDYTFGTWIQNGTAYIKQCKNCSRTSYSVNVFGAYEIADFEGRNTIALKNSTSAVEIKFSGNQIVIVLGYEYLLQDSSSQSVKVYIDGVEKQTITLTGTGYNAYTVNLDTTGNHVAKIYKVTDESAGLVYLSHFKGTGISFLASEHIHDFINGTNYASDISQHWKVCLGCDLEDSSKKVSHSGGYESSIAGKICEYCGYEYTSPLGTDVVSVVIPEGVKVIDASAFRCCKNLKSVTLPSTITTIGENAFADCVALETINLPASLTIISNGAFKNCSSLTDLDISSVKYVGEDAFLNCSKLTFTKLPTNAVEFGESCFQGCSSITYFDISYLEDIPNRMFYNCTSLTNVDISNNVKTIGNEAFRNTKISSFNFSSSIVEMGEATFQNTQLTSVNFQCNVTSIPAYTFKDCAKLTQITLPSNLEEVGMYAFYNSGLTSITLPETTTTIKTNAFAKCASLVSANLPKVKITDTRAFEGCVKLTNLYTPSITHVGEYSFIRCSGLKTVTMPSIVRFQNDAFNSCSSLTTLNLGASLVAIEDSGFFNCQNLSTINYGGDLSKWSSVSIDEFNSAIAVDKVNFNQVITSQITNDQPQSSTTNGGVSQSTKENLFNYSSSSILEKFSLATKLNVQYSIVCASGLSSSCEVLNNYISSKCGQTFTVLSQSASLSAFEIIVGDISCQAVNQVKGEVTLSSGDFIIRLVGNKIVILGYDDIATAKAIEYFATKVISADKEGTVYLASDFDFYFDSNNTQQVTITKATNEFLYFSIDAGSVNETYVRLCYTGNKGWRIQTKSRFSDDYDDMGGAQRIVDSLGEKLVLNLANILITKSANSVRITECNNNTYVVIKLNTFALNLYTSSGKLSNKITSLVNNDTQSVISTSLLSGEAIFGGASRAVSSNHRGRVLDMYTYDLWDKENQCYLVVPLFSSSRGSGMFINRYERMIADIGNTDANVMTVTVHGAVMDCYLFATDYITDVLYGYSALSGFAEQPEEWSYGMIVSRYYPDFSTTDGVNAMISAMEEYNLPWTGILMEGWDTFSGRDAEWTAICNRVHAMGKKVLCYIAVGEMPKDAPAEYFLTYTENGVTSNKIPQVSSGTVNPDSTSSTRMYLDITNPEAVDWYKEYWENLIYNVGIDGIKIDFCELIPDNLQLNYYDKTVDIEGSHHWYPTAFCNMMWDLISAKPDGGLNFSRGGGIGSQNAPFMWAGDQTRQHDRLQRQLNLLLSSGLSGVPFQSYDMAGYQYGQGSDDIIDEAKVLIRGTQFSAFTACMQTHGNVRRAYDFAEEGFSAVTDIYRVYCKLHELLTPYITENSIIATQTGMPMARHLVLMWQNDKNVYNINDEFMFGDAFLIAPELNGNTKRDIYLPEGVWEDLNTGKVYDVGAEGLWLTNYQVSMSELPVFYNHNSQSSTASDLLPAVSELLAIASNIEFKLDI